MHEEFKEEFLLDDPEEGIDVPADDESDDDEDEEVDPADETM